MSSKSQVSAISSVSRPSQRINSGKVTSVLSSGDKTLTKLSSLKKVDLQVRKEGSGDGNKKAHFLDFDRTAKVKLPDDTPKFLNQD